MAVLTITRERRKTPRLKLFVHVHVPELKELSARRYKFSMDPGAFDELIANLDRDLQVTLPPPVNTGPRIHRDGNSEILVSCNVQRSLQKHVLLGNQTHVSGHTAACMLVDFQQKD